MRTGMEMQHHCFIWERSSLCARSIQLMLNLLQSNYRASIVTDKKHSTANAKLLVLLIHSFPFVIILNIQTRLIIQNENHAIMPPYRSPFQESSNHKSGE